MLLLARHARGQEVYSIDECFLLPPEGTAAEQVRWARRLKPLWPAMSDCP